jgi:hypothetical protein
MLDRGHDSGAVLQGFVGELSPAEARVLRTLLDDEDRVREGPS